MRAMPPLYVLIWWSVLDHKHMVSLYDRLDDACSAYDESEPGYDVIGGSKVMEVTSNGTPRLHWAPFDIVAHHRWWTEDKIDDGRERDRIRAQVRREQMP